MRDNSNKKNAGYYLQEAGKGVLIAVVIVVVVAAILLIVERNNQSNAPGGQPINQSSLQITWREATMDDMVFSASSDVTLGYKFEFTPSKNISGLVFRVDFYEGNTLITSKTKSIGNVVKGGHYTFSFSASEFSFGQLLKIDHYQTSIAGGTISLI